MLNRRQCRGVSVVEAMVVLAILAVILGIALPSYTTFMANQRIRATTESLRAGLQLARIEALKRGRGVFFNMAGLDSSWTIGCETPIPDDNDGDGLPDCPAQIQFSASVSAGGSNAITVTPSPNSVLATFSPLGLVRQINLDGSAPFTQIDVTVPNISSPELHPLRVVLPAGGLSRICDPSITTAGDTRLC
jgi:type IV fimbrial biogenesis protein FimT